MSKTRPHFKVHISLPNHPKMVAVYRDNTLLATWTRIGILAVKCWAGKTGGKIVVPKEYALSLTGKNRSDSAAVVLRQLASSSPLSIKYRGDTLVILIPNFLKKQGLLGGTVAERSSTDTDTEADTEADTTEREKGDSEADDLEAKGDDLGDGSATNSGDGQDGNGGQSKPKQTRRALSAAPSALTEGEAEGLWAWCAEREAWAIQGAQGESRFNDLVEACLGWHQANAKRRADWYKTCQNWIRKERTDGGRIYQATQDRPPSRARGKRGKSPIADAATNIANDILAENPDGDGDETPDKGSG